MAAAEESALDRFTNVEAVLPEVVVAAVPRHPSERPVVFHRLDVDADADDPRPACRCGSGGPGWALGRPEDLRALEGRPCVTCFRAIVEQAALDPEEPVRMLEGAPELPEDPYPSRDEREAAVPDGAGAIFGPQPRERPPLRTLVDEVLVASKSSDVYHAPATQHGEAEPLCGAIGDFRETDPSVYPAWSRRPCAECFDLEAIDWPEEE